MTKKTSNRGLLSLLTTINLFPAIATPEQNTPSSLATIIKEPEVQWSIYPHEYWRGFLDIQQKDGKYYVLGQHMVPSYRTVVQLLELDASGNQTYDVIFAGESSAVAAGNITPPREITFSGASNSGASSLLQRCQIDQIPPGEVTITPRDSGFGHSVSLTFLKTREGKYVYVDQGTKIPTTFHTDFLLFNSQLQLERATQISTHGFFLVRDACETYDGGISFVGDYSTSEKGSQAVALKFSKNLESLLWSKVFGEGDTETFRAVAETKSGALLASGESGKDRYLVRMDTQGNTHWEKKFGAGVQTRLIDMIRAKEGDFLMLYRTEEKRSCGESPQGCFDFETFISRFDEIGNFSWTKSLDAFSFPVGQGVTGNSDGEGKLLSASDGMILAGFTSFLEGHFNQKLTALKDDFLPWQEPITYPVASISPKKNLVMIVHGYNSFGKNNWPESMSNSIREKTNGWDVQYYDWSTDAKKSFSKALATTTSHGDFIANYVDENDFEKVHLIGHSMGAWIVEQAAKGIREKQPSTQIQITFLDPFISNTFQSNIRSSAHLGKSIRGLENSYAEQYYADDILTGSYTGRCALPNLHNISLNFITGEFYTHEFPREWYEQTARYPYSTIGASAYGFVRSYEGGGYYEFETSKVLPRGNTAIFIGDGVRTPIQFGSWITGTSATGTVFVENEETILETDGSMWAQATLPDMSNQKNISFSYVPTGFNARFTMYLNNEPFFEGDQRVTNSQNSVDLFLDNLHPSDQNILSIRFESLEKNGSLTRQVSENSQLRLSPIVFSEKILTQVPVSDHLLGKVTLPPEVGDVNADGIIDSADLKN